MDLLEEFIDTSNNINNNKKSLKENVVIKSVDKEPREVDSTTPFIMFMAHIAHTEYEYLVDELNKLEAEYVLSAEVETYEHFHFLVRMSDKKYHAFSKRIFKDKYSLRGRAVKGQPRQYGKIKNEIENLKDALAYTLKDKNYKSNMTKERIEEILEKKIEEVKNNKNKDASKLLKENCLKYVEEHWKCGTNYEVEEYCQISEQYTQTTYYPDADSCMRVLIIQFLIINKIGIRKSLIETYYYYIVANTKKKSMSRSAGDIYRELYVN
jgi:hypothetical protein